MGTRGVVRIGVAKDGRVVPGERQLVPRHARERLPSSLQIQLFAQPDAKLVDVKSRVAAQPQNARMGKPSRGGLRWRRRTPGSQSSKKWRGT